MAIRLLFILAIAISGCSKGSGLKLVPVTGSVKYKGAMVEGAVVTFMAKESPRISVGVTDSSGRFALTTMNTNDGAIAGDNQVTITKMPPKGTATNLMKTPDDYMKAMQGAKNAKPPGSDLDGKNGLPPKYADIGTSGLKRTVVVNEKNDFNFELTD